MDKEENIKEKIARIKEFRPIDDIFFELLARNREVCQEILQTIMEDKNLIVTDSIVQSSERNIYGRSVRLDAICTLGDGTLCNIEVQRSNNDDHLRRARYNASMITIKDSDVGKPFKNVKELYIVYISEFDIFKEGKTTYHLEKRIIETGTVVDDGLHEIFVNAAIDDKSDIAELMSCFLMKEVNSKKFPKLTEEVTKLKCTEGGLKSMCEVMDKYIKEENIKKVQKMLLKGILKEDILEFGFSEEEIKKAEEALLQMA